VLQKLNFANAENFSYSESLMMLHPDENYVLELEMKNSLN